jgi:hypothetical protein
MKRTKPKPSVENSKPLPETGTPDERNAVVRIINAPTMSEKVAILRSATRAPQEAAAEVPADALYKGNSVEHWWAKAKAYGDIVFHVCEAFRSLGYDGDFGDTATLPARLQAFADSLKAAPTGAAAAEGEAASVPAIAAACDHGLVTPACPDCVAAALAATKAREGADRKYEALVEAAWEVMVEMLHDSKDEGTEADCANCGARAIGTGDDGRLTDPDMFGILHSEMCPVGFLASALRALSPQTQKE